MGQARSTAPLRHSIAPPTSDAIAIARVIAILGIVYVHAWTGVTGAQMAAMPHGDQVVFRWIAIELFGRSAVPLLGMISGYLVAGSTRTRDYRRFLSGKFRTILMPMLWWNVIAIVIVSGAASLGLLQAPLASDWRWILDEIFCLTYQNDINVQMGFLRDLFVCMAAVPILLRLGDRGLAVVAITAAAWVISGWHVPLLLRPQILLFFVIGIAARRHALAGRVLDWPLAAIVAPFALLLPLKVALSLWQDTSVVAGHAHIVAMFDLLVRLAVSVLVWRLALRLAGSPVGTAVQRFEPYAFLMFCSHLIMIWVSVPAMSAIVGPMGSPGWPMLFLLHPLLAMGATVALGRGLAAILPAAAEVLSGGRLKPERCEPRRLRSA